MSTATAEDLHPLFEPIEVGGLRLRNRVAMSAHTGALPSHRYLAYLAERAGGVGLVVAGGGNVGLAEHATVTGPVSADPASFDALGPNPATAAGIARYDEVVVPLLRARAEVVHEGGARCVGQVFHLGAYKEVDDLRPAVGPSAVADEEGFGATHELEPHEIDELVVAHAHAVRRTQLAGMDGAELHAAHGFLLHAFLSPLTNRRGDRWGGPLGARARFLVDVLAAARQLVGPDYPIGLRITGHDAAPGGLAVEDVAEVCRQLQGDLAYVSVSGGSVSGLRAASGAAYASSRLSPDGHHLAAARAVRAAVDVPVLAAGRVMTPAQAAEALRRGDCDVVAMARALIADPAWVAKAAGGRPGAIRPCIGANECHHYHGARAHLTCAVNARAGRELDLVAPAPARRRHIVVVGGGPGGLEAARVAAGRGHRVTLLEGADHLGGQAATLALDPTWWRLAPYLAHQGDELRRLGVDVHLGRWAGPDDVLALGPDAVVVATGAATAVPEVPGLAGSPVAAVAAADVVAGAEVAGPVLVVGGLDDHLAPLDVAALLAERGHRVEVVSERVAAGLHADRTTLVATLRRLAAARVAVHPLTALAGVEGGEVTTTDLLTGRRRRHPGVATVVLAGHRAARVDLARRLRPLVPEVHVVGDAQAPRRIAHAVLDGHRVGVCL